jgi:Resolvase, N terminal domain
MTANKAAIRWCAVYTRKSSEEGLEQQFNSLDAQREAAEAYIKSQRHEGWRLLAEKYDDGGYSGGNLERPALKRLVADIRAGTFRAIDGVAKLTSASPRAVNGVLGSAAQNIRRSRRPRQSQSNISTPSIPATPAFTRSPALVRISRALERCSADRSIIVAMSCPSYRTRVDALAVIRAAPKI